jgi:hypothetical protein
MIQMPGIITVGSLAQTAAQLEAVPPTKGFTYEDSIWAV